MRARRRLRDRREAAEVEALVETRAAARVPMTLTSRRSGAHHDGPYATPWSPTLTPHPMMTRGSKEIYFIGCIDILCEYGLKKQLEHHYKAAKHGERVGAQNFSVVDPLQYSTRFQNFVAEALD